MFAQKTERRIKIKHRIANKIRGTQETPRLSVYRSNNDIYAQIIDDAAKHTLVAFSSRQLKGATGNKVDKSKLVGAELAKIAAAKGISQVVFDRNGFLYHGRVKALAEGAREGGLKF